MLIVVSIKALPEKFNQGSKIHHKCGWHHPMNLDSRLNIKRKIKLSSLLFPPPLSPDYYQKPHT